jgi:alginate O-acetyltransferase complex protein AlgI
MQGILYGLVFIVCVATCAKLRSHRTRQGVLLISSYALYVTWGPWFAVVLLTSTIVNFLVGAWLRRKQTGAILATGIVFNLALLSSFKYLPEAAAHSFFSSMPALAHLAMPLGISFWTFQAMSYLLDLYRGEELDPTFLEFAFYMVFFPVNISGPICRMPDMLPQIRSDRRTTWGEIEQGLRRIATGIFMVQLGKLIGQGILGGDGVNSGFDRVTQWSGPDAWCLALGFGLQLFLDFGGYSHIAIGAAKAMGFTLPENFDRPLHSASPSVFWTRWHMSLSFWIRDYVFLPLATMRRELWWRNLALVVSMVTFGLWHRASLLFLLWGLYHGVLLVLHRQVQQIQRRLDWEPRGIWNAIGWVVTMALVNLGWIFFRAQSLAEARLMLAAIFSPASYTMHFLSTSFYVLVAIVAVGYGLALAVIRAVDGEAQEREGARVDRRPRIVGVMVRWRWYWLPPLYGLALLFLLIVTFTRGPTAGQFMYNKF